MSVKKRLIAVSLLFPFVVVGQSFSVGNQETLDFYDGVAKASVGKVVECVGVWAVQDPPDLTPVRCGGFSLSIRHPSNYINVRGYLHNGWEIIERQHMPYIPEGSKFESQIYRRVWFKLRKFEAKNQYVDPSMGPLDAQVRP